MNIQSIKNDDELRVALLRLDEIWGAEKGTPNGDELEQLVELVQDYEDSIIIRARKNQPEINVNVADL